MHEGHPPEWAPPVAPPAGADRPTGPRWDGPRWFDAELFVPLVLVVAFGVGVWATSAFARNHRSIDRLYCDRADGCAGANADLDVWITLLGAIGGTAVCLCIISVVGLFALAKEHGRWPIGVVLGWVGTVVGVLGAVFGSLLAAASTAAADSLDATVAQATRPISLAVGALSVPGLMYFSALRSVARLGSTGTPAGSFGIGGVTSLRKKLVFQTTAYGTLLTLIVIATGMRRRALLALDPDLDIPPEQVLLYGLVFAAMLALFYFGANRGISELAAHVIDDFAPLPQPGDPDVAGRLQLRATITSAVEGATGRQTFEASVVILAPLVTGLISAALSS